MAEVEHMEKIVPLITCEIALCQYVCELVFGVGIFDLKLWIWFILSNNQSRATLWVLDTCLFVGLLLLIIILVTASLSSKMHSIAPNREDFVFDDEKNVVLLRAYCSRGRYVRRRPGNKTHHRF